MTTFVVTECGDCDGMGEECVICFKVPDNCNCPVEHFKDCTTCGGDGVVEEEINDEEGEGRS